MATEILMPRQGNTVESCLILEWRKQEGRIRAGRGCALRGRNG